MQRKSVMSRLHVEDGKGESGLLLPSRDQRKAEKADSMKEGTLTRLRGKGLRKKKTKTTRSQREEGKKNTLSLGGETGGGEGGTDRGQRKDGCKKFAKQ